MLIDLSQQRALASLYEGGGPRSGGGSVLKENIVILSKDTPPVS